MATTQARRVAVLLAGLLLVWGAAGASTRAATFAASGGGAGRSRTPTVTTSSTGHHRTATTLPPSGHNGSQGSSGAGGSPGCPVFTSPWACDGTCQQASRDQTNSCTGGTVPNSTQYRQDTQCTAGCPVAPGGGGTLPNTGAGTGVSTNRCAKTGTTTKAVGCSQSCHLGYYQRYNACGGLVGGSYEAYDANCPIGCKAGVGLGGSLGLSSTCTPNAVVTTVNEGCTGTCHEALFQQFNSCGTATDAPHTGYAASCTAGCSAPAAPAACTPNGTITTVQEGCTGTCHQATFQQFNSCGTATDAPHTGYAAGCTLGCGTGRHPGCTPNGTIHTVKEGCTGTCHQATFQQFNSCGTALNAPHTGYAAGCPAGCASTAATTPTTGGACNPLPASSTTGPLYVSGPTPTGCASQGVATTTTTYETLLTTWSCVNGQPTPTTTPTYTQIPGEQPTSDCQPGTQIISSTPVACETGEPGWAWLTYHYRTCLTFQGSLVDCGPIQTWTEQSPYQTHAAPLADPAYDPGACPVPTAVGN